MFFLMNHMTRFTSRAFGGLGVATQAAVSNCEPWAVRHRACGALKVPGRLRVTAHTVRFLVLKRLRTAMLLLISMTGCSFAAADDRIDDVMYQDPAFPATTTRFEFSEKLKPLWLEALHRPESELQRLAADTIAYAHRSGMKGLNDSADKLIDLIQQKSLEASVQNAAARALVALNATQAAEAFGEAMNSGSLDLAMIVEPALARWDYAPAREIWRSRLADPSTERARLLLAINCLGVVKDSDASSTLMSWVTDVNAELPTRLAAARAAASINDSAVLETALALTSDKDQRTDNLLAANLLNSQTDPKAVSILKRLAANDSTAIAGLALRRLFELDPANVYEFAESSIDSDDVNVRRVGCEALVHRADPASIRLLGDVLDDSNPKLRRFVSNSLIQLAQRKTLQDAVLQASMKVVSEDAWRGLEQAIIVLGTLDHELGASRFFELLDHRRPEVAVAAGWGLRKLAIAEALPQMLEQAEMRTKLFRDNPEDVRIQNVVDAQLSQLYQAFGEMDFQDAETLMRKFIPKNTEGPNEKRAAAVWALGKLKEGKLDEPLAKLLANRLSDINPDNPELEPVRRMSAIALGRMNAESQLGTLRRFAEEGPQYPGQASAWSLERMTGEVSEFSLERIIRSSEWFLTPR